MGKTFNELALDLKDFIIEKHANYRGLKHMSLQRYNNLTVSMNSRRYGTPHVIIRVGISEAAFSFPYVNKIDGGLGMDERYVMLWVSNDVVQQSLEDQWKTIKLQEFEQDKS